MANDDEWVQDVRRWYFGGHPPQGEFALDVSEGIDEHAIGYEAASPALTISRWPDTRVPGRV